MVTVHVANGAACIIVKDKNSGQSLRLLLGSDIRLSFSDQTYDSIGNDFDKIYTGPGRGMVLRGTAKGVFTDGLTTINNVLFNLMDRTLDNQNFGDKEDVALALAILRGDKQAALIAADYVLENYHREVNNGNSTKNQME